MLNRSSFACLNTWTNKLTIVWLYPKANYWMTLLKNVLSSFNSMNSITTTYDKIKMTCLISFLVNDKVPSITLIYSKTNISVSFTNASSVAGMVAKWLRRVFFRTRAAMYLQGDASSMMTLVSIVKILLVSLLRTAWLMLYSRDSSWLESVWALKRSSQSCW